MPELPEVETMCRGIAGVVGHRIVTCDLGQASNSQQRLQPISIRPALPQLKRRLADRQITAIERFGKRVCLRLDDHQLLVFEPRMTGLVLLTDPPTTEHVRFRLTLTDGPLPSVVFWDRRGLGTVQLLSTAEIDSRLGLKRLGPDALRITPDELRDRVSRTRRPVKVALLDQQLVAGIGNLYAAEILFVAGISPRKSAARLTRTQWQRLHAAMLEVLHEAIHYEGSTLGDGTYRNALNQTGSYQNHHRVYDRAGDPCPRCSGAIVRIVQAQRSTFFCKGCQK